MPIYDKYKIIFIHIPKCGGSSINEMLGIKDIFDMNRLKGWIYEQVKKGDLQIMYGNTIRKNHYYELDHALFKHIFKNHKVKCKEYFKFAVVRNPYERLLSEFFYNNDRFIQKKGDTPADFTEFLMELQTRWGEINKLDHFKYSHFYPQYFFTNTLDVNKKGCAMDYVCKLEEIDELCGVLKEKTGFNFQLKKENVNSKKSKINKEEYLTPENKEIIYRLYKKDFAQFGYAK